MILPLFGRSSCSDLTSFHATRFLAATASANPIPASAEDHNLIIIEQAQVANGTITW